MCALLFMQQDHLVLTRGSLYSNSCSYTVQRTREHTVLYLSTASLMQLLLPVEVQASQVITKPCVGRMLQSSASRASALS
jgi:hypothetical protein